MASPHSIVAELEQMSDTERRIIQRFLRRERPGVRPSALPAPRLGDRIADQVAAFGGSWRFIFLALAAIAGWMLLNAGGKAFDPYPFILLNLVLSCLAALQAPIIMMSQNRQDAKDRVRSEADYRVNVRAMVEIAELHEKFDRMRGELKLSGRG